MLHTQDHPKRLIVIGQPERGHLARRSSKPNLQTQTANCVKRRQIRPGLVAVLQLKRC